MPTDRIKKLLCAELLELETSGALKAEESVTAGIIPPTAGKGPRYLIEGEGDRPFIRMNSNGYLGMSLRQEVMAAEEAAIEAFGVGPAAVRFISGTTSPHVELEKRLAEFHDREAAMIYSSAYAAVMGILPALISSQTAVISDALNHNCIINAIRLAGPKEKRVYGHLDLSELETHLKEVSQNCRRAIIVTDGIFSMRGDHAPLAGIMDLARKYDGSFDENVLVVVDDSHGVGAFGKTGRGVEEYENCGPVDLLVATLGKAFGVNGGYVTAGETLVRYLREKSPFYVYSNPITAGEAAAAKKAVDILDSPVGLSLLEHLRQMTAHFEKGLEALGYETIPSRHPVTPLMIRDTRRTSALVDHLRKHGVLATGLNYPIVPKGDEEIRFQVSADHLEADIDEVLSVLNTFGR